MAKNGLAKIGLAKVGHDSSLAGVPFGSLAITDRPEGCVFLGGGVILALQFSDAVHLGVDNLNVVRHVGRLLWLPLFNSG